MNFSNGLSSSLRHLTPSGRVRVPQLLTPSLGVDLRRLSSSRLAASEPSMHSAGPDYSLSSVARMVWTQPTRILGVRARISHLRLSSATSAPQDFPLLLPSHTQLMQSTPHSFTQAPSYCLVLTCERLQSHVCGHFSLRQRRSEVRLRESLASDRQSNYGSQSLRINCETKLDKTPACWCNTVPLCKYGLTSHYP